MLGNENNEKFINGIKYRWAITDTNGWDLTIKELRKIKLEKLKGEDGKSYLLHVALHQKDTIGVLTSYFSFEDMILKIEGKFFKCESLEFAEKIITSLCDGGQYEVFPKHMK